MEELTKRQDFDPEDLTILAHLLPQTRDLGFPAVASAIAANSGLRRHYLDGCLERLAGSASDISETAAKRVVYNVSNRAPKYADLHHHQDALVHALGKLVGAPWTQYTALVFRIACHAGINVAPFFKDVRVAIDAQEMGTIHSIVETFEEMDADQRKEMMGEFNRFVLRTLRGRKVSTWAIESMRIMWRDGFRKEVDFIFSNLSAPPGQKLIDKVKGP